jgi:cytochrome c oxidase subunit 3
VKQTIVRNVNELPTYGFGSQSGPWWGAMAFIALEGMGFAIAIAAYLYLYAVNPKWPLNSPPPDLWPGTLRPSSSFSASSRTSSQTAWRTSARSARRAHRPRHHVPDRTGLAGDPRLRIRASQHAMGSGRLWLVVWLVLALHTTHLATDVGDTIVLTVLMFTRHATPRRFSDVTDNVFYWNFVVLAWLPLYVLLDWVPRL